MTLESALRHGVAVLTQVTAGRYTVRGVSLGGMYTALHVPELDTLFDVGMALRSAASASVLCLSHGHVDHFGSLPALLGMRALMGIRRPMKVLLPAALEAVVHEVLAAVSKLHRWPLEVETVPMEPGTEVRLHGDLIVRAFRTYHPVPSLGFLYLRRVTKIRPQFEHLPGAEIARRRRAGDTELFETVERREFAYATDTLPTVLEREPQLLDTRTLVLECTFLDARKTVADARAGCHIHLDELLNFAPRFRNEALVLMHFSQIYKPSEVRALLDARWPTETRGLVVPFAPTGDHWPG